jgi:hypothetical protein
MLEGAPTARLMVGTSWITLMVNEGQIFQPETAANPNIPHQQRER